MLFLKSGTLKMSVSQGSFKDKLDNSKNKIIKSLGQTNRTVFF